MVGLARPAPLVQLIHWQGTGAVRELKWYEHACGEEFS
jgi:hypothetical protein